MNNAGNPGPRQGTPPDELTILSETAEKAVGRWIRRIVGASERLAALPDPDEADALEALARAMLGAQPPPRGTLRWTVTLWLADGPREQAVDLDPARPAREQALRRLSQAARIRRTLDQATVRREALASELAEAEAWKEEILGWSEVAPDRRTRRGRLDRLEELQKRLLPRGLWPQPPRRREEPRKDVPLRFVLEGGWILLAGRSGTENDFLTGKLARPDDLWFHAAHVPGAHVILKRPGGRIGDPPREILEKAAGLAAWLSKLRAQDRAEVHCALRRHVRKPRKAPPGSVLLEHSSSVFVRPAPPPRTPGGTEP